MRGLRYKDIQEKYNIIDSQLISLIQKYKWKRKSNRSKVQKKNQNAKGNKGGRAPKGNKNAVTTGEYENIYKDVLEPEELELYEKIKTDDREQLLIEEYKILTIREQRMLKRIKELKQRGKDMTTNFIRNKKSKSEVETVTDAEPTLNMIQRIEDGLTRVQESKRRCIESLNKIGIDTERLEIEKEKLEIEKKRLEIELQNMDGEEIEDTSETDADIYGS